MLRAVGRYRGATRSWAICRTRVIPVEAMKTVVRRRDVAIVVAEVLFSVGESPVAQTGYVRATSQVLSAWAIQREDS